MLVFYFYMAKRGDRAAAIQNATARRQSNAQHKTRTRNSTHNFRVTRAAHFTYFVIPQRALHRSAVRTAELARSTSSSRHYVLLACRDIRRCSCPSALTLWQLKNAGAFWKLTSCLCMATHF